MPQFYLSAPATSGNLGPGFDQLGLAYDLRLEIEASLADQWSVTPSGHNAEDLPTDENNLILKTYINSSKRLGINPKPLAVKAKNPIPICGGLGSSATAIACGLGLARMVAGIPIKKDDICQEAAAIEGHPDNVAPAIFGGLTLCRATINGFEAQQGKIHPNLKALMITPDSKADTASMRAALPESWPEDVMLENHRLVRLLIHGIASGDPAGLRCSQFDRMHQPYRFALQPKSKAVFDTLCQHEGIAGAFLSGSGPTVAGWVLGSGESLPDFHSIFANQGIETEVRLVNIDHEGLLTRIDHD